MNMRTTTTTKTVTEHIACCAAARCKIDPTMKSTNYTCGVYFMFLSGGSRCVDVGLGLGVFAGAPPHCSNVICCARQLVVVGVLLTNTTAILGHVLCSASIDIPAGLLAKVASYHFHANGFNTLLADTHTVARGDRQNFLIPRNRCQFRASQHSHSATGRS